MSVFGVYYSRVGGAALANGKLQATTGDLFATRAEAQESAVAHNCKAFTQFFFWVVEVGV